MMPHITNEQTGDETANLSMNMVPLSWRPAAMKAITVVMEDRLRRAMMYPDPSKSYEVVVKGIFKRLLASALPPPRPKFVKYDVFTEEPDKNGRYFYKTYKGFPYYNKPTFWNRVGTHKR